MNPMRDQDTIATGYSATSHLAMTSAKDTTTEAASANNIARRALLRV